MNTVAVLAAVASVSEIAVAVAIITRSRGGGGSNGGGGAALASGAFRARGTGGAGESVFEGSCSSSAATKSSGSSSTPHASISSHSRILLPRLPPYMHMNFLSQYVPGNSRSSGSSTMRAYLPGTAAHHKAACRRPEDSTPLRTIMKPSIFLVFSWALNFYKTVQTNPKETIEETLETSPDGAPQEGPTLGRSEDPELGFGACFFFFFGGGLGFRAYRNRV